MTAGPLRRPRIAGRPVATTLALSAMLAVATGAAALLVSAPANLVIGATIMLALDVLGVVIAAGTARRCIGLERAAFACTAALFALWAAASVIWLANLGVSGEIPPDDVVMEAIWGGVAILAVATVILIYLHHREGSSWAGPLDAAVVTLALAIVAWHLYFSGDGPAGVEAMTTTAHFAVLGGVATAFAAMTTWRRSSVHRWLRWGVIAMAPLAGDIALRVAATREESTTLRVWAMAVGILALGCIIVMALVRREEPASPAATASAASGSARSPRSRVTRALPSAALIGAVAVVTWDGGLTGTLAILAVALLVVRVAGSQRTVEQLLDQRSRWALTDPLTGIHNRRLFEHELSVLDARLQHHHVLASIIALDLDRFKEVNDTRGHGVGDVLLREVATALAGTLRDGDQLFRLGGDEFMALLPATATADAERIGDRLRVAVAAAAMQVLPDGPMVTASVGVAAVPPGDDGVERAREAADRALYLAKERGRNRVVTAEPLASRCPEA